MPSSSLVSPQIVLGGLTAILNAAPRKVRGSERISFADLRPPANSVERQRLPSGAAVSTVSQAIRDVYVRDELQRLMTAARGDPKLNPIIRNLENSDETLSHRELQADTVLLLPAVLTEEGDTLHLIGRAILSTSFSNTTDAALSTLIGGFEQRSPIIAKNLRSLLCEVQSKPTFTTQMLSHLRVLAICVGFGLLDSLQLTADRSLSRLGESIVTKDAGQSRYLAQALQDLDREVTLTRRLRALCRIAFQNHHGLSSLFRSLLKDTLQLDWQQRPWIAHEMVKAISMIASGAADNLVPLTFETLVNLPDRHRALPTVIRRFPSLSVFAHHWKTRGNPDTLKQLVSLRPTRSGVDQEIAPLYPLLLSPEILATRPSPTISIESRPTLLITGATGSLGTVIVNKLQREFPDHELVVTGRNSQALLELAASSPRVTPRLVDLASPGERDALLRELHTSSYLIAGYVNAAAQCLRGFAPDLSPREQEQNLAINATGPVDIGTRIVQNAPQSNARLRLIFISSAAEYFPLPTMELYAASKRLQRELVRSMANDPRLRDKALITTLVLGCLRSTGFENTVFPAITRESLNSSPELRRQLYGSNAVIERLMRLTPLTPERVAGRIAQLLRKTDIPPVVHMGIDTRILLLTLPIPQRLKERLARFFIARCAPAGE